MLNLPSLLSFLSLLKLFELVFTLFQLVFSHSQLYFNLLNSSSFLSFFLFFFESFLTSSKTRRKNLLRAACVDLIDLLVRLVDLLLLLVQLNNLLNFSETHVVHDSRFSGVVSPHNRRKKSHPPPVFCFHTPGTLCLIDITIWGGGVTFCNSVEFQFLFNTTLPRSGEVQQSNRGAAATISNHILVCCRCETLMSRSRMRETRLFSSSVLIDITTSCCGSYVVDIVATPSPYLLKH